MATLSDRFIEERRESWERIRKIILAIRRGGYTQLSPEDARDFPNLYRKICTDSETAKTMELAPDTCDYINSLVLQAHSILYSPPKKSGSRFIRFFTHDFPYAFAKNLIPVAFIFILFFGIGLGTFFFVYFNPDKANHVLSEDEIYTLRQIWATSAPRSAEENVFMAAYYIYNNVSIAFFSFVLGISFGVFTIIIIFFNAVKIGGSIGLVFAHGYAGNMLNFIIAHSAFELLGICLAAGAGFAIGLSMILPTQERRTRVISRKAREVMPIILVAAMFITAAAFIEGFVSPSSIHIAIKIAIAAISLAIIVLYTHFVFIRRFFRHRKLRKKLAQHKKWIHQLRGGFR